jgi:hypothetical protein
VNEAVRIVADWLNDTTTGATGVNDILALSDFPKDAADSLPSNPTYYDSTRNAWASRGNFPQTSQGVTYPCVVTRFMRGTYPVNRREGITGDSYLFGEASVAVIVAHRLQDTDEGVEDIGYLVRAVLNSLMAFHEAAAVKRQRNAYEILLPLSIEVQPYPPEHEDNLVATSILIQYKTRERTVT